MYNMALQESFRLYRRCFCRAEGFLLKLTGLGFPGSGFRVSGLGV